MPNRLLRFAKLAYTVAQRTLPERAHRFAPKRYTQPQLLACLLLKEYLALDYRTAQENLALSSKLQRALGLTSVPDYTTLWRFASEKAGPELITEALAETVALLRASGQNWSSSGSDPPLIAVDSTGLYCTHASRYFEKRRAKDRPHRARAYQKWAAALWVGPQLVAAQLTKPGPCGDYPDLPPLALRAFARVSGGRAEASAVVLADAGYDSEKNHAYCRAQLGVTALIPAKTRRFVAPPRGQYRREMVERLGNAVLGVEGDAEALGRYGKRWLVETLMSVVKRKWGGSLTARRSRMQERQMLLRGLVYNLYRLVKLDVEAPAT